MIIEWIKENIWTIFLILVTIGIFILYFFIGTMLGVIDWTPRNCTEVCGL